MSNTENIQINKILVVGLGLIGASLCRALKDNQKYDKVLGYDLELENLVEKDTFENKTVYYASSSTEKKYVPNFLIDKDIEVSDLKTLLNGLKLVGDYLDKTILKPNNLNYPNSRLLFINSLK